jgi:hypothetical protein
MHRKIKDLTCGIASEFLYASGTIAMGAALTALLGWI